MADGNFDSEEEGSSSSDEETIEMLVPGRERRNNAGAKMSQLIQGEEAVDDFYMSAYGGFNEDEEDDMYTSTSSEEEEKEESDSTDSDFDVDEKEESGSEKEDHEIKDTRKHRTTKAYKEPVSRPQQGPKKKRPTRRSQALVNEGSFLGDRKARRSTLLQTKHVTKKRRESLEKPRVKRRKHHQPLSQEALLREAKETEKLNLKSLEKYQQLELEMKSKRNRLLKRKGIQGEKVSYLSLTVVEPASPPVPVPQDPLDIVQENCEEVERNESQVNNGPAVVGPALEGAAKKNYYSRNFVVFSSDYCLRKVFPVPEREPRGGQPRTEYCVVTGERAKYKDPLTGLPYSTPAAFKKLREAYEAHVEAKGDRNDPLVAEWLRWKHEKKA